MPYYPSIPPISTTVSGSAEFTGTSLETISVSPTNYTLPTGSTVQFYATGTFKSGSNVSSSLITFVSWSSSDTSMVTINQTGLATWVSGSSTSSIRAAVISITGSTTIYTNGAVDPGYVGIFTEDANIVDRIYFQDNQAKSTKGYTWFSSSAPSYAYNATVGVSGATLSANNQVFTSGSSHLDFGGNFAAAALFFWPNSAADHPLVYNGAVFGNGYLVNVGTNYVTFFVDGTYVQDNLGTGPNNKYMLVMFGRNNGTAYLQVNSRTLLSTGVTPSSHAAVVGLGGQNGSDYWPGELYEFYFTTTAASSATFAAMRDDVTSKGITLG